MLQQFIFAVAVMVIAPAALTDNLSPISAPAGGNVTQSGKATLVTLPVSRPQPTGFFNQSKVMPGSPVTLSGKAFFTNRLNVLFRGKTHVGSAQVDEKGDYKFTFRVPFDAESGEANVVLTYENCGSIPCGKPTTISGLTIQEKPPFPFLQDTVFQPAVVPPGEMVTVWGNAPQNALLEFFFMGKKSLGKVKAGTGRFMFSFQVPLDAAGDAYLTCTNCAASTVALTGLRILQPNGPPLPKPVTGAFSTTEAKRGEVVRITGKANPGTLMSILFMGKRQVGYVFVNEKWVYDGDFQVPMDAAIGEAFITVGCNDCTNGWYTIKGLTIVPEFAVQLSHTLAPPMTNVTFSGTAKPAAIVRANYVHPVRHVPIPLEQTQADSSGQFSYSLIVPDALPGKLPIVVECDTCEEKTKTLELTIPARLSQPEGMPGSAVTIQGISKPGATVTARMRLDDGRWWSVATAQTDATGKYSGTLIVPKMSSGKTVISVECDKCGLNDRFNINFTVLAPPPPPPGQERSIIDSIEIVHEKSRLCLDVPGGKFEEGVQLQLYECNRTAAQRFVPVASGELMIGGFCVDAFGRNLKPGNRIGLGKCNGGIKQKWMHSLPNGGLMGVMEYCMDVLADGKVELGFCSMDDYLDAVPGEPVIDRRQTPVATWSFNKLAKVIQQQAPYVSGCTVVFVHGLGANRTMWLEPPHFGEEEDLAGYDVAQTEGWDKKKGSGTLGWRGLTTVLRERGFHMPDETVEVEYQSPINFSHNSKLTFEEQARQLDHHVTEVLRRTGKTKVILVGHSMGGIASLRYIENTGGATVAGLVTFGTPYSGAPSSNLKTWVEKYILGDCHAGPNCSSDAGVRELQEGSSGIQSLGLGLISVPETLPIHSIVVGQSHRNWIASVIGKPVPVTTNGDGVVPTANQDVETLRKEFRIGKRLNTRSSLVRADQAFGTVGFSSYWPFAKVSGQIHTKEARDPKVQAMVIEAITAIDNSQCRR